MAPFLERTAGAFRLRYTDPKVQISLCKLRDEYATRAEIKWKKRSRC